MTKLTILLLLSVSLCFASKIGLRDPGYWKAWNNIDLLNEYMSGFNFGLKQLQSDATLNEMAQAVAESEGCPLEYLKANPMTTTDNVLVFGIKLRGKTTYQEILTQDYNTVLDGSSGFLSFRYKNNTMNVEVNNLKELMDVCRCDTLTVPLNCNQRAAENLWRAATGEFKFANENYNYGVKVNNMLRVFQSMSNDTSDRYSMDLFKNTHHTETYKNDLYEMTFEVPDFFGAGFWSKEQTGVWGIGDQATAILTHGGNIRATSTVQHQYVKVNLEINEPPVVPVRPTGRLSDADLRDVFENHFRTMYEMFDRDQMFKSFTRYGEGYGLDANGDINIVFSLSGPVNPNAAMPNREMRQKLFNRLKMWPWFVPPPTQNNQNPYDKNSIVKLWTRAMQLSMGPINEDRQASGLPAIRESDASLTALAQAAADKMAAACKFVDPVIDRKTNTLVVAMTLSGQTKINEYAFLLNDDNFGQVTCFDNFSNQRHKVFNLIDNLRYACSKNSPISSAVDNWKKYTTYGTGHAVTPKGDVFIAIALTY